MKLLSIILLLSSVVAEGEEEGEVVEAGVCAANNDCPNDVDM